MKLYALRNIGPAVLVAALVGCGGGSGDSSDDASAGVVTPAANPAPAPSTAPDAISVNVTGPSQVNRGALGVFTAETNAGINADFEWTLLERPEGSLVDVNPNVDQGVVPVNAAGSYQLQVIVSDGAQISEPVIVSFTGIDAGPQPPRPMVPSEIEIFSELSIPQITRQLTVPSSFRILRGPTFVQLPDDPSIGGLVYDFESQNALGVALQNTAVCTFEWNSTFWGVNLDPVTLQLCTIL